jgi:glycine/D-amino acid oxidase-like deaminating enzyme
MAEFKADAVVLGAGMVGVGAALHLQQRGATSFWSTGTNSPGRKPVLAMRE